MFNCQFIGSLGKDSEVKEIGSTKVINFSVAVNTGYGDKKETIWIECAKFGEKTGVAEYLKKGTKVYISGQPGLRSYDKKDGTHATSFTLRVNEIELIGSGDTVAYTKPAEAATPSAPLATVTTAAPVDDLPF